MERVFNKTGKIVLIILFALAIIGISNKNFAATNLTKGIKSEISYNKNQAKKIDGVLVIEEGAKFQIKAVKKAKSSDNNWNDAKWSIKISNEKVLKANKMKNMPKYELQTLKPGTTKVTLRVRDSVTNKLYTTTVKVRVITKHVEKLKINLYMKKGNGEFVITNGSMVDTGKPAVLKVKLVQKLSDGTTREIKANNKRSITYTMLDESGKTIAFAKAKQGSDVILKPKDTIGKFTIEVEINEYNEIHGQSESKYCTTFKIEKNPVYDVYVAEGATINFDNVYFGKIDIINNDEDVNILEEVNRSAHKYKAINTGVCVVLSRENVTGFPGEELVKTAIIRSVKPSGSFPLISGNRFAMEDGVIYSGSYNFYNDLGL